MARRSQQEQVYEAQRAVPRGRLFANHDEAQRLLDEARDEPWWDDDIYRVEVKRLDNRNAHGGLGRWDEDAGAGLIGIRDDCLDLRTVVHELAHVVADKNDESTCHDPAFCRAYLTLAYHMMGSDAFVALRNAFEAHGVVHDEREEEL